MPLIARIARPKMYLIGVVAAALFIAFLLREKTYFNQSDRMNIGQVTELILTPFGNPHPYNLGYVAQYRFVHQVGEFLVRRDNLQNFAPGLAKSWTIANDRRSIVFHIRPEIYTAEEVKQSLVRLFKKHQTSHSNIASQIASADDILVSSLDTLIVKTIGDAGALLAPLVMADTVILPDDHWLEDTKTGIATVDWRKSRGPYIFESGSFPAEPNSPIIFKPNPNHYFFNSQLLRWKILYQPIETIPSMTALAALMAKEPSYTTVRYWDMLKIFDTQETSIQFYETKPNGIAYIEANPQTGRLDSRKKRRTILKRLFSTKIPLNSPSLRAFQIAQPGLSGKMNENEISEFKKQLNSETESSIQFPLRWHIQNGPSDNPEWVKEIARATADAVEFVESSEPDRHGPEKERKNFDLGIFSVGMSDTDPISGATFLFSPDGCGIDLPDGKILSILNSAKQSTDRTMITTAVKSAFRLAMDEALIMPISYVTNRHYYSDEVELNIQDPFAESVRIWEVRIKQ